MCGICGIIDWNNSWSTSQRKRWVAAMNTALQHRGPDATGDFSTPHGTLAMRRLAIVDIAGGDQPIFNERGNIGVVFNGEIYNHLSLKKQLEEKGHRFTTTTDTEVLVHLYEEYGTEMLPLLKGMFSFCIFDRNQETFFLARDRFGEKPLYYSYENKLFSFSSEIKSLLENPQLERTLNRAALPYYFRTSLVPEPLTLLEKVKSLPAGHFLFLSKHNCELKAYFSPAYESAIPFQSEEEAIAEIRPRLIQAIQRQLRSDVPIGAFLSGGIDSSTVVALAQKYNERQLRTFHVRFEEQAYDESAIARKVANFCGTEHREIMIPNLDFSERIFWEIIEHVGLPFRDSSAIPSYFISQAIGKEVKVALSGDGGDELFGGYALFQWYQKVIRLQKVARPVRSLIDQGLGHMQHLQVLEPVTLLRKLKRGVRTSLEPEADIPIALNELFQREELVRLLGEAGRTDLRLLKNYPKNLSPLRKIMHYRLQHTLPANMLIKVDRMSMAHSLEVRAPFLDPDLFAASLRLPDDMLIKAGEGKYLLRKIMQQELPTAVFSHPKMGFNIPLHRYQNQAFQNLAHRLLFEENPLPNLIPKAALKTIYQKGISQKKDTATNSVFQSAHQLWMMMQLFGWAKKFNLKIT